MRLDGRSEDIARYETRTNYMLIRVSIIEFCDGRIELKCEVDKEPEKCGVLRLDGTSATDHIAALSGPSFWPTSRQPRLTVSTVIYLSEVYSLSQAVNYMANRYDSSCIRLFFYVDLILENDDSKPQYLHKSREGMPCFIKSRI
jgi:hypothetical protein